MQDMADPMFAYCRQHVDKELRRSRRRNWMALQPFVRARQEESKLAGSDVQVCAHTCMISLGFGAVIAVCEMSLFNVDLLQNRIQRKLSQHICAYQQAKASQPAPWGKLVLVSSLGWVVIGP